VDLTVLYAASNQVSVLTPVAQKSVLVYGP
jgi:hypothetical protein